VKNVLVLNASLQGDNGNSSQLTSEFVTQLQQTESIKVEKVDLNTLNLPHLSAQEMQTWSMLSDNMTPEQATLTAYSNDLLAQLERSDVIVVGMPMYNFTIPSTFKVWIDRVARAGRTFSYTSEGPKDIYRAKPCIYSLRGAVFTKAQITIPRHLTYASFLALWG